MKPAGKRALVAFLMEAFQISERHGCRLLQCPRSTQRYRSCRQDDRGLALRLKELALARPRFGYRRLHVFVAAGRLGGESQAYLPPVLRGGAVGTDQAASEAGGGDSGSGTVAECARAMLEYGFCDGPVAGWTSIFRP